MSSLTSPSFVDDGSSFRNRVPHHLYSTHLTNQLNSFESDTLTAYTGSFIDDGADMLPPPRAAPGFGRVDPRFYGQRKRRDEEKREVWNDDIQKAVVGDIRRSLNQIRSIGVIEVKRSPGRGKREKKDTVTISLPPRWGTFVIKADHGRIIVIDEDGEFDSGPLQQQELKKWVEAPTAIELPSLPSVSPSEKKIHKDKENYRYQLEPSKSLTTISESEHKHIHQPSISGHSMSPTGFSMTGGASEWPSGTVSSIGSPIKSKRSSRHSFVSSPGKDKSRSPLRSPPGGWPSPPLLGKKGNSIVSTSTVQSWGEEKSCCSHKNTKSSRHDVDNTSNKTYSTYKPAAVEDAPDTSSENNSMLQAKACNYSQKNSASSWGGSNRVNEHSCIDSRQGSRKTLPHSGKPRANVNTHGASVQNWVSDHVKTVSEASTQSRSIRDRSQTIFRVPSEISWDGYEIPKTMSEVSIAGTGSERSWSHSQTSSRHSQDRRSKGSSRQGHKSSTRGSSTGWQDSEHSWRGSQKAIVGERVDTKHGPRWDNGKEYDVDSKTYLNEDGVRVRMGSRSWSRRESVSGWE